MQLEKPLQAYTVAIITALLLAAAWWVPGTPLCAALGWIAAAFLVLIPYSSKPYRAAYLVGLAVHPLAFYWLFGTIKNFGHFPLVPALLIFLLFVVLSSVQFLFFILAFKLGKPALERFALTVPVAWMIAEGFSVRIFPWYLGHTQLGFTSFAQIADIAGSSFISFIMLWLLAAAVHVAGPPTTSATGRRPVAGLVLAAFLFIAACVYGSEQVRKFGPEGSVITAAHEIPAILVQGNVSLKQKHNRDLAKSNLLKYERLATMAAAKSYLPGKPLPLVIMPETILLEFIGENVNNIDRDRRLPRIVITRSPTETVYAPALFGALAYNNNREIFNSVFASTQDGSVPIPYHKQILMPFGEYTPFGDLLPWLKEVNATAADFSRGTGPTIFDFTLLPEQPDVKFKASPLVCYEDVAPDLSREAVRSGAQLLVNVTNDAWFGDTVAPHQHNLIAAFRAVENKRYLLRATNTGLTNIVNPLGKTAAKLPGYSEGALSAPVHFLDHLTIYTTHTGDALRWLILLLWAACSIWGTMWPQRAAK